MLYEVITEVLRPWHALRRRLKSRLGEPDYQALLEHELALERLAQQQLLAVLPASAGGSDARAREPLHCYLEHLGLGASPRITSYNVCYTKLLRGHLSRYAIGGIRLVVDLRHHRGLLEHLRRKYLWLFGKKI